MRAGARGPARHVGEFEELPEVPPDRVDGQEAHGEEAARRGGAEARAVAGAVGDALPEHAPAVLDHHAAAVRQEDRREEAGVPPVEAHGAVEWHAEQEEVEGVAGHREQRNRQHERREPAGRLAPVGVILAVVRGEQHERHVRPERARRHHEVREAEVGEGGERLRRRQAPQRAGLRRDPLERVAPAAGGAPEHAEAEHAAEPHDGHRVVLLVAVDEDDAVAAGGAGDVEGDEAVVAARVLLVAARGAAEPAGPIAGGAALGRRCVHRPAGRGGSRQRLRREESRGRGPPVLGKMTGRTR